MVMPSIDIELATSAKWSALPYISKPVPEVSHIPGRYTAATSAGSKSQVLRLITQTLFSEMVRVGDWAKASSFLNSKESSRKYATSILEEKAKIVANTFQDGRICSKKPRNSGGSKNKSGKKEKAPSLLATVTRKKSTECAR